MNLDKCQNCTNYQQRVSDSILCRYQNIVEYIMIDGNAVISCPMERPGRR